MSWSSSPITAACRPKPSLQSICASTAVCRCSFSRAATGCDEVVVGQVGQDVTAPECKATPQFARSRGRLTAREQPLARVRSALELLDVHSVGWDREPVAPVLGEEYLTGRAAASFRFEGLAQMEDIGLDSRGEPARWTLTPQHVRELVDRRTGRPSNDQPRQNRALLTSPERHGNTRAW